MKIEEEIDRSQVIRILHIIVYTCNFSMRPYECLQYPWSSDYQNVVVNSSNPFWASK